MTDLKYVVSLSHRSKGIAFSAREALRNAVKQGTSPIRQAVFSGEPTGASSRLEVTIDDELLCRAITTAIDTSGRMPHDKKSYTVNSIVLQEEANAPEDKKDFQPEYVAIRQQVDLLLEENAQLRQDLMERKVEVQTPLDGLLAYFESTKYSPEVLLDDSADLDFARRVFGKKMKNTFSNYITHILGESVTEEEVEQILAFTAESSDERTKSGAEYETAKTELAYLQTVKSGKVDMPGTVRESLITLLESRKLEDTIRVYEARIKEEQEVALKQEKFRDLKVKYNSFSEKMHLLAHAGGDVPVIFNYNESGLELYFPFRSTAAPAGFVDDLQREVGSCFGKAATKSLGRKFVVYQVSGSDLNEGVDRLVEDAPVTLRVAGFNRIIPYGLG